MSNKILFITPYGGYSGSEISLINLVNLIVNGEKNTFALASLYDGELLNKVNTDVFIYRFSDFLKRNRIKNRIRKLLSIKNITPSQLFVSHLVKVYNPDVVVLNTVMLFEAHEILQKLHVPVVQYVHELKNILVHLDDKSLNRLIQYPAQFITNSNETKKVYEKLGRTGITVIHPGIDLSSIEITKSKEDVRIELGIPIDAHVWCMSGALDENKNPKLFVDIARAYIKENPKAFFVWIGGDVASNEALMAINNVKKYGLTNKVIFTGQIMEGYYNYLNIADGFLLTSSQESFSLVTLESLFLGKFIVANDCGGVREIITDNKLGVIIKEGNLSDYTTRMIAHDLQKEHDANDEYRKIHSMQFDISVTGPQFYKLLQSVF